MDPHVPSAVLLEAVIAGLVAALACGLGALPLMISRLDPSKHIGIGYGLAGGLMFSASVYNLILPALQMGSRGWTFHSVYPILAGIILGAMFLSITDRYLHRHDNDAKPPDLAKWGGRTGLLVFLAMTVHSIPEGVAVGTGYTAAAVPDYADPALGTYIALAIAIHNIPEGLAVAIPLRTAGASIPRCFAAAFLTSLPQPIAAIPAVLLAWLFKPLMPFMMGFAAGAMIFLVVLELIPEALASESPSRIAWAFTLGFCIMLLIQVIL